MRSCLSTLDGGSCTETRARGACRVPSTETTFGAKRDSSREDQCSVPKRAPSSVQPVTPRPAVPAHLNWNSPPIRLSDEPVIRRAITLVHGKWKIAILCELQDGPVRVGELKRRMSPISKKVLNQHLRRMEKDGLLIRTEFSAHVPHVQYSLTNPLGTSVVRLLQTMVQWSAHQWPAI